MHVVLRPATQADEAFLEELFREVRAAEFSALCLPQVAINQLLDLQYRAQKQGYAAQFPFAEDSIICVEGEPAGRLLVARTGSEVHLVDIALLARYRGQGIGGSLLRNLCDEARAASKILSLAVRADNPVESLYRRLGLVATGSDGVYITMELRARDK